MIDVSCGFVGEVPSSYVITLLSLGSVGLVKVEIYRLWFITWPRSWCVMQLYGWGPFILSHQSAKFGIHRPCESGDIASLILSRDHLVDVSRDFMRGFSHPKSSRCKVWGPKVWWKWNYSAFLFVTWPRYWSVTRCCGWSGVLLWTPNLALLSLVHIHRMELEIMAFVISVPVPFPIPIPMWWFQCRG